MTDTITYEVRRVRDEEEMAAVLELRHSVFCEEQGVPEREELDGRDREGMHLVAVAGEQVLATCRLLFVGPTVQFSRLAVHIDARRQGIASALLALADDEARAGGARRLVLHAQTYARTLYERAGYEPRGRVFMEAGIEHIAMEKYL
jgi:predicted GNAT family N-acyltransferase